MIDYLYYKLYQATLKTSLNDIPEFMAPVYLGGLISINIDVLYIYLVKIDVIPYVITNTKQGGLLSFFMILMFIFIYKKERRKMVLKKYSQESNSNRIKGNIIVFTYVIISFLLIFAVGLYKPGKL